MATAKLSTSKERRATGRYLVEGQHPVAEVVADGRAEVVFTTLDRLGEVAGLDGIEGVELVEVSDHVLQRLADAHSPQGLVAVARQEWVTATQALAGPGVAVLLVDANDPGNVGAIIRTADAAGADAVLLTRGSCDPHTPKAVRAAAGSLTHVHLAMVDDPTEGIEVARANGRRVLGLAGGGELDLLAAGPHPGGDLLVMGSEAHGLPDHVRTAVDAVAFVPIRGRAESLNLSVATAIALYAVTGGQDPRPARG